MALWNLQSTIGSGSSSEYHSGAFEHPSHREVDQSPEKGVSGGLDASNINNGGQSISRFSPQQKVQSMPSPDSECLAQTFPYSPMISPVIEVEPILDISPPLRLFPPEILAPLWTRLPRVPGKLNEIPLTTSLDSFQHSMNDSTYGSRTSSSSTNSRDYISDLTDPNRRETFSSVLEARRQKCPQKNLCHLCPKKFTRAYNLRSHLRTHTDVRPFVCTICGKSFARQHDRKRHEGLHLGEKKWVCKGEVASMPGTIWGCGRQFAFVDALGRHFKSEAGRLCIKPLLNEELVQKAQSTTIERAQNVTQDKDRDLIDGLQHIESNWQPNFLPRSLLAQFPQLENIDGGQRPQRDKGGLSGGELNGGVSNEDDGYHTDASAVGTILVQPFRRPTADTQASVAGTTPFETLALHFRAAADLIVAENNLQIESISSLAQSEHSSGFSPPTIAIHHRQLENAPRNQKSLSVTKVEIAQALVTKAERLALLHENNPLGAKSGPIANEPQTDHTPGDAHDEEELKRHGVSTVLVSIPGRINFVAEDEGCCSDLRTQIIEDSVPSSPIVGFRADDSPSRAADSSRTLSISMTESEGERSFVYGANSPMDTSCEVMAQSHAIALQIAGLTLRDFVRTSFHRGQPKTGGSSNSSGFRGSQRTSDVSSASSLPSSKSPEQLYSWSRKRSEGAEEREDGRRAKKTCRNTSAQTSTRLFACPFYRFDMNRYSERNTEEICYRGCSSVCLRDISRLKQHLYRVHQRPKYFCGRCNLICETEDLLDAHSRQDPVCETSQPLFRERMSNTQMNTIKRRSFGRDPHAEWFNIYKVLFPEAPTPLSSHAYVDVESVTDVQDYLAYFEAEAPRLLSMLVHEYADDRLMLTPPNQEILDEAFEYAAARVVLALRPAVRRTISDQFETRHDSQALEDLAQMQAGGATGAVTELLPSSDYSVDPDELFLNFDFGQLAGSSPI